MTKHSPLIFLASAQSRYRIAEESCPHWDYESDGYGHACCDELADAERALRALLTQQAQQEDRL